ncbi:molybdopterin-guanine dinucleotide biosynthesis protein A [Sphingomonas zeicaulis]|uniref:molybdenum cofactor guanylyltransferase n=1 Tax=Sphingomonas zeicaulis TaxID=1632740 RepID=UPI003D1F708C
MRRLGVVLAGGRSSRFGSDKALARFDGRTLLDHALGALQPHVDAVAIVGRAHGTVPGIADWPAPDLGPLGGLCGALRHAAAEGYDAVLSCSVDCLDVPADLLTKPPCYLAAQPVIGLWPVSLAAALEAFLASDPRRSMRGFAAAVGAAAIDSDRRQPNINTPADLAALGLFRPTN